MIPNIVQNAVLIFHLLFKLIISLVKPLFTIVIQIVPIITISTKIMFIDAQKDQSALKNMEDLYMVIDNA